MDNNNLTSENSEFFKVYIRMKPGNNSMDRKIVNKIDDNSLNIIDINSVY